MMSRRRHWREVTVRSNGGGMSFALSCTLSNRIAAVGLVGSAQTLPWTWCEDHRPVPMINFHGTADRLTPYKGGVSWVSPGHRGFPNQLTWTANWAQRNHCAPNPVDSVVAPDVTRRLYTRCADDATVVLYSVRGGGHTWPGGGPMPEWYVGRTSRSIDASSEMWAFFREHPLRIYVLTKNPAAAVLKASLDSIDTAATARAVATGTAATARTREQMIALVNDPTMLRGLRFDYLNSLAVLPCTSVRALITGPTQDVTTAFERARKELASKVFRNPRLAACTSYLLQ